MSDINLKEFEEEEIKELEEELLEDQEIKLTRSSLQVPLKTLRLKKAVCVEATSTIRRSIDMMLARQFGCLLIVENNKYNGIFTERDILRKIVLESIDLDTAHVCDYMTEHGRTLTMEDTIESALRIMQKDGLSHVCIIDAKAMPQAVVSIRDIIRFIIDFFPQSILNLPPNPIRIGTNHPDGG